MSPTSCQLLYPAMYLYMSRKTRYLIVWLCKDSEKIFACKFILDFFLFCLVNALRIKPAKIYLFDVCCHNLRQIDHFGVRSTLDGLLAEWTRCDDLLSTRRVQLLCHLLGDGELLRVVDGGIGNR